MLSEKYSRKYAVLPALVRAWYFLKKTSRAMANMASNRARDLAGELHVENYICVSVGWMCESPKNL